MSNHIARIAQLNDLARTAMGVASRLHQTCGICALPPADQSAIREKVEKFDTFRVSNDPYQERDFGSFEHNGHDILWKIDYYDLNCEKGSEHPEDPEQTTRVLTIMLREEWGSGEWRTVMLSCGHDRKVRRIQMKSEQLAIGKQVECEECAKLAKPGLRLVGRAK
jgi:hypothetical protein